MLASREQRKKLSDLELELTAARQEGFAAKRSNDSPKNRPLLVIGVFTTFRGKKNRDAVRKAWMGTGILFSISEYFIPFCMLSMVPRHCNVTSRSLFVPLLTVEIFYDDDSNCRFAHLFSVQAQV